jgi:predicted ATPase/class 3 adenylate cyclase
VSELPTGTVTFLFTDLESSTRLWEEHPDAMRDALARHDEILRDAVDAHRGRIVKGRGDGLHAVFATAEGAIEAAVEGQVALGAENWGETGPLRARMGLHTGVAEQRGGDYFGPVLNRAARLAAVAHPGQVLCSLATAELVRDSVAAPVALVELGRHQLRDLARPELVFQATHPELSVEFPPLRSVDAFPGNLPVQVTSLVGRGEEIAAVGRALAEARLVTLTGVGGVGKTRLAVQTAAEVVPSYVDGAWLCELAAAGDPDAMVQVIAAALGVHPDLAVPLNVRVREWLRARRALVVLDNCEHLLDAASRFADEILRGCLEVRLLATSREPLDIDGERVMRVRSLRLPDPATEFEDVTATDAVQLFVERASSAEPDFQVTPAVERTLAEICRRLDGIPLAIELAAARVVSMSPGEILERLDERFRLLTGGRRTAVERHQTLRATVDWSYSLLEPSEQLVFDRLGVFPSSFDVAAAGAVASGRGIEDWDVLDALNGLVHKSMVTTIPGADATRYQLLETMRQYAREHLDQGGDADRCRRAHAAHYAQFANEVSNAFATGEDVGAAWAKYQLELDNYRAAVTWALDSDTPGDSDLALYIAVRLAGAGPGPRRAAGLIAHAERLLERAESSSPELRGGILAGMAADALFVRGDKVAAQDLARRALADTPSTVGVVSGSIVVYTVLSLCAASDGDYRRALELLADGRHATAHLGDETTHHAAYFESLIASMEAARGDLAAARAHATEAVRLARESELPIRLAQALTVFARVCSHDDPDAAERALDEVIVMPRVATSGMLVGAFSLRAQLRAMAGDSAGALAPLHEALLAWDDSTAIQSIHVTIESASAVFVDLGELQTAAVLAGAATAGPLAPAWAFSLSEQARTDLNRTIDRLRTAIGPDAYDIQAAHGAAMSRDDLLRFLRNSVEAALASQTPATRRASEDLRASSSADSARDDM